MDADTGIKNSHNIDGAECRGNKGRQIEPAALSVRTTHVRSRK